MAPLDTRFSRPSATALGMGALGVVSVGLISTGLWYDSHRSAQAVERAREQVTSAQTAVAPPEPVAVTTSERDAGSSTPDPTETSTESPAESPEPAVNAGAETGPSTVAAVRSPVPTLRPATPVAAVAPRPVSQAPAPTPVAAQGTPVTTAGGAADTATGDSPAEPSEQEITQPVEPAPAPGGVLPGLIDLVRPFLPQPNVAQPDVAQQAPAAEIGAGAADEEPGLNP